MQFRHATEELPFGEPLNVRSAWEVRARAAICPCHCPLIGVLRSCPCSNLLADQGVMATAAISAVQTSRHMGHHLRPLSAAGRGIEHGASNSMPRCSGLSARYSSVPKGGTLCAQSHEMVRDEAATIANAGTALSIGSNRGSSEGPSLCASARLARAEGKVSHHHFQLSY
jgi:hypothetical protein